MQEIYDALEQGDMAPYEQQVSNGGGESIVVRVRVRARACVRVFVCTCACVCGCGKPPLLRAYVRKAL